MSIRPEYANAIMAGRKRVEFRKRRLRADVRVVLVYASAPVQRVIGYFTIGEVDEGKPAELWKKYQRVGCIDESSFNSYYAGAKSGVAIGVDCVTLLDEPVRLSAIRRDLVPPQSFCYLDMDVVTASIRVQQKVRSTRSLLRGFLVRLGVISGTNLSKRR